MSTESEQSIEPVTATEVVEGQRMGFLPDLFGKRLCMEGEASVYTWMARLSPAYRGGYWLFYRLSNGGFYMAPKLAGPLPILVEGNGYGGEMSADAAGIVATLFTLSHLMFQQLADEEQEQLERAFYQLREFVGSHAESRKILAATD